MKFCRRFRFVDIGVLIHGGSLEWSEMIQKFQIREGAMAGSHVEDGGEQVRGKDSGPSTQGRKDKSRDAISSLEGRFVRLELGVADTKEGMDLLEQSMEKAVEDLKVQIQDLQEGM